MFTKTSDRRVLPGFLSVIALFCAALFHAVAAHASVELRVEARPISEPIQAFVTVTEPGGDPVGGLTVADFSVTLDGEPVVIDPATGFTLPPAQDPNQRVSIVFAMDFSSSVTGSHLDAMRDAVITFIDTMNVGDFAAIVKFNANNPARASVVWSFTEIDQGANNLALINAVMDDYPGAGSNVLEGVDVALDEFIAAAVTLPPGPKAIIVVTDGGENSSNVTQETVVALANGNSIPVFTVGVGDVSIPQRVELLTSLAADTGGQYFPAPTEAEIIAAYVAVSTLLNNEYLLTIPSSISDCDEHTLQVTVTGEAPASATFTRRDCDTTPDSFSFATSNGVSRNATVTSNAVTITGLEAPADIQVSGGTYSIGCGSTFTVSDGVISNGQTVCVRHTASADFDSTEVTTLTIDSVSATFTSRTAAGSSGGGGAIGLVELLLCLAAYGALRRRRAGIVPGVRGSR